MVNLITPTTFTKMNCIFIIHGWDGNSQEERYRKLKSQLKDKNFKVHVLDMPNTSEPKITSWVSHLEKAVGVPDSETYFVGNSIGCQTILRYLQKLPEKIKVGGVVFSAGWINLKGLEDEEVAEIAKPWLEAHLNWERIKSHCDNFVCIFSDDDPYVFLEDKEIFKEKLGAEIFVEHNKGHFPGYDSDLVFREIVEMALKK